MTLKEAKEVMARYNLCEIHFIEKENALGGKGGVQFCRLCRKAAERGRDKEIKEAQIVLEEYYQQMGALELHKQRAGR